MGPRLPQPCTLPACGPVVLCTPTTLHCLPAVPGDRPLPSYEELRKENGIELLVRMLYAGMQE